MDATAHPLRRGIGLGQIDYYAIKPWRAADELFHRTVTENLHEWVGSDASLSRELTIVAEAGNARASELRSLLSRNRVPFVFHPTGSPAGRQILDEVREPDAGVPVVVQRNGRVLVDPTNVEIAEAYGARTRLLGSREYDVTVVGAGPSGLAAAVYASSEGLRTLVIERETIGGQAGSSRSSVTTSASSAESPVPTSPPGRSSKRGCSGRRSCRCARPEAIRSDADRLVPDHVELRGDRDRRRRPRHGRQLPPAGHPLPRRAGRTRRLLRCLRLGGGAVHRALGLRRGGRQLGRAGRRPPGRACTQGDDPGATHDARRDDVALPYRGDRRAAQHRRSLPNRDRRRNGRRRAREPHPARLRHQA